jgi:hypothetical protein
MRILSGKDYSWLMGRIETLSNENERLQMKVDEITKEQPNDCKSNEGSHFCSICEFGYLRTRNPFGADFYACSKTVSCESFKRKEDN